MYKRQILCLVRSEGVLQLSRSEIKLHKDKVKQMLRIGLPAGLQGIIFSISNVLIQSSINSFGSLVKMCIRDSDSPAVSSALTKENYQVTRLATTGGFLRAGNTTLIVGTDDDKVERAIEVIGEYSRRRTEVVPSTASYDIGRYASFPVEVQVGGATIFVLDVEKFVKL